ILARVEVEITCTDSFAKAVCLAASTIAERASDFFFHAGLPTVMGEASFFLGTPVSRKLALHCVMMTSLMKRASGRGQRHPVITMPLWGTMFILPMWIRRLHFIGIHAFIIVARLSIWQESTCSGIFPGIMIQRIFRRMRYII
ncbi:MAG: hypothetical protein MR698_06760, partial [Selenomonas sp.]|nr:hypothetical protein [Selenomonas sp.]